MRYSASGEIRYCGTQLGVKCACVCGGGGGEGCNASSEMMKGPYFKLPVIKVPMSVVKGVYFSDSPCQYVAILFQRP